MVDECSMKADSGIPRSTPHSAQLPEKDSSEKPATNEMAALRDTNMLLAARVEELKIQLSVAEVETLQATEAMNSLLQQQQGADTERAQLEDEVESLRTYNDVMATRLANFQQQLGEARDDMSDEMTTMQADHGVLQEELDHVKQQERQGRVEAESLRMKLDVAVREKEEKLAAANICVNDVKEVVEALAKQLHGNQRELEHERNERTRLAVELDALRTELAQLKTVSQKDAQAKEQEKSILAKQLQEAQQKCADQMASVDKKTSALNAEVVRLKSELTALQLELETMAAARVETEARLQEAREMKEQQAQELEVYQQREQSLGDELERLTSAVDEKLEGFEVRERQLEAELDAALQENAELQAKYDKMTIVPADVPSDRVTRLQEMVQTIGVKQEETMEALRATRHADEVEKLQKMLEARDIELEVQKVQNKQIYDELQQQLTTVKNTNSTQHGAAEELSTNVESAATQVQQELLDQLSSAVASKEQSQAELKTLKILYESLQGQHAIQMEKDKLTWQKERSRLSRQLKEAHSAQQTMTRLLQQSEAETIRLRSEAETRSNSMECDRGGASMIASDDAGCDTAAEAEVQSLQQQLAMVVEGKADLEMEVAMLRENVRKLREEGTILKTDKEEAVAQAHAIRGVLGQELDAMEEQLEHALTARAHEQVAHEQALPRLPRGCRHCVTQCHICTPSCMSSGPMIVCATAAGACVGPSTTAIRENERHHCARSDGRP